MKKSFTPFLLIPLLCSCSYINSNSPTKPTTPQEQLCTELKRNLIFNTSSTSSIDSASTTQRAEMTRLYEKNNCDKIGK
jgi:hypothetical protein